MAFDANTILAVIGAVVGIVVATRTKKPGVAALLVGLGIWWTFAPVLNLVTGLLNISALEIWAWLTALVSFFGLGAAFWFVVRMLNELK